MSDELIDLQKENAALKLRLLLYEQNGPAKLYYSLNRKASEIADILNKTNLINVELDDPKSKTFERIKILWNEASSLAVAVKSLGEISGVTGDEKKDTERKPFVDTIAIQRP